MNLALLSDAIGWIIRIVLGFHEKQRQLADELSCSKPASSWTTFCREVEFWDAREGIASEGVGAEWSSRGSTEVQYSKAKNNELKTKKLRYWQTIGFIVYVGKKGSLNLSNVAKCLISDVTGE